MDWDTRVQEFVSQPSRKTDSEVRLHLRAKMSQSRERQEIRLDAPEEIPGRQVKDFHGAVPRVLR